MPNASPASRRTKPGSASARRRSSTAERRKSAPELRRRLSAEFPEPVRKIVTVRKTEPRSNFADGTGAVPQERLRMPQRQTFTILARSTPGPLRKNGKIPPGTFRSTGRLRRWDTAPRRRTAAGEPGGAARRPRRVPGSRRRAAAHSAAAPSRAQTSRTAAAAQAHALQADRAERAAAPAIR